jgi:hypothetical protein
MRREADICRDHLCVARFGVRAGPRPGTARDRSWTGRRRGDAKSSRLIHAEAFVTTALTDRMVAIGVIEQCKMPAFLDSAKSGFSDELKAGIGHTLFDGQPDVSYQEFLDRLAKVMSGIGKTP